MSKISPRQKMPPGLSTQIVFAILLTLCAVLVLPSALSAGTPIKIKPPQPGSVASAGEVKTTVRAFSAADFSANAFSDWDSPRRK